MTAILRALLLGLVRLLAGAQARWQGAAPLPRQRIYFANHGSHLDTFVIIAALPPALRAATHPVAAKDYWEASRLRRYIALDCLNAVLVDRHPASARNPLRPLIQRVEAGQSLILFPEGSRGGGTLGPFKAGLYLLALRFPEVELVPVYLENSHRALPKGSLLLVPLLCTARFGAPVAVRPGEGREEFLARAREAVLALAERRAAAPVAQRQGPPSVLPGAA
jgi:1-acyl-sn-glycerol-3-phosphate acyltransferase